MHPLIFHTDIDIGKIIGQGEFGAVMEVSPKQHLSCDLPRLHTKPQALVVKQLKHSCNTNTSTAAIDLINECKLLSTLNHPNIVTLCATIGQPGDDGLGLILERLSTTLEEKIETEWMAQKTSKHNRRHRRCLCLNRQRNIHSADARITSESLNSDRLTVLYEIVKAMTYLHKNR